MFYQKVQKGLRVILEKPQKLHDYWPELSQRGCESQLSAEIVWNAVACTFSPSSSGNLPETFANLANIY